MTGEMIKALAANGGVIMINFGSGFIGPAARLWRDNITEQKQAIIDTFGADSKELKGST